MRVTLVAVALGFMIALPPSGWGQTPCAPTPSDAEGPFYTPGAPRREATGKGLVVSGVVRSAGTCAPVAGARVEWWQANPGGRYEDSHRGHLRTAGDGSYRFETDFPPPYVGRPSHVHLKVFAAGHRTLTTQLYPRAGQTQIAFDLVLVKE
jgi:protocatechuate 3,4-dioxygenase beta subunit